MAGYTLGAGTTRSTGYTITSGDGNGFVLTNNGTIGATTAGFAVVVQTTGDFVYNAGKILASTASGDGIFATHSVRITNRSGGLISASYGVQLSGGGTLVNASGGSIAGRVPIYASVSSLYVGNQGAITGTGTSNTQGGVVLNAGGYVYNKPNGSISGANGVLEGVFAKVRNAGTITGNNADGVELNAGGTVTTETQTPNSAATISGSYAGIVINGAVGYVLDVSGISGGTGGVFLQAGGYLHQIGGPAGKPGAGTITANYAVAINNGSGTVDTGGAILGTKLGVGMDGAGPHKVTLSSIDATISGAYAISIAGGSGYVYDKGTINAGTSGVAIIMAGGYNNLIEIYAGAKIIGNVNGGNFQDGPHTTTLLLAQSGGTLTGFGDRYYNIGNVTVNTGANWTMDSTDIFVDPSFVSAGATTFVPGTLVDAGTLTFGGSEYARLTLAGNAHLTVSKGGVLTPAYASQAIYAPSGASSAVVVTDGHITAGGNDGIRLDDGGTVTNQADGVISANSAGVRIENAKGTVTNLGQIKATLSAGIALNTGGSVANTLGSVQGTIQGTAGVVIYGASGTVTNTGAITGTSNYGVKLAVGGTITNTGGTIKGTFGISIVGAGTVTNTGQITGTSATGIEINGNGTVTNTGGTIQGLGGPGVVVYDGAGSITNTGQIKPGTGFFGAALYVGGAVSNQAGTIAGGVNIAGGAGTVTNYSVIRGYYGTAVTLASGFTNRVRIRPGASFSGAVNGGNTAGATSASTIELLSAAGAGTINGIGSEYQNFENITVNSGATWTIGSLGAITANQTLVDSGTVTNEVFISSDVTLTNGTLINATGFLSGDDAVVGLTGTNVVVNNANIRANDIGVSLATPGRVTNQSDGFIGGRIGVYIDQGPGASVVNQGVIEGYMGVYLLGGGSVDNQAGLISGRLGVVIPSGSGTVRNAGTIVSVGDYGVILPDHGADRLVLVPGSTIAGLVHGGLAGTGTSFSTMELAAGSGGGTIGGIGSKYFNFVDLIVDSGAAWTFASGQTIAGDQTVTDNGTLTNDASVLTDIELGSGATLTNASGGIFNAVDPVITTFGLANAATVVNYGLLDGSGGFYGVELLSGGSVTNRAGIIKSETGVAIAGAGTVTNTGYIGGSDGTAVSLLQGFQNRVAMSPGAVFTGKVDGGNTSASGTAISTLELMTGTSAGTLSGIGSQYLHFQSFLVDPGASWTIASGQVVAASYTLTDNGTLTNNAIALTGVTLGAGASLLNQTGAMISSASDGAIALGAGVTLINRDDIHGDSVGVSLIGPSAVVINDNAASISGSALGASISGGTGTVTNYGEIAGGLIGVALTGGGTVVNYGEIAGLIFGGVEILGGAGTLVNDGTIVGGGSTVAVLAVGYQNLVKLAPGAVFSGTVNGGNTIGAPQVSTLELTRGYIAGRGNYTGTVSGLGSRYINFGQITVDPGASWLVTGNPTLAAGITLTNSGVLTIADGALSAAGNVNNFGVIQETAGTVTTGNLAGTGQVVIGAGSTLIASGSVGDVQTVAFTGAGVLALAPTLFSGQIDGLGSGGSIKLTGIADATSASVVNGNTLAIPQSAGPTIDLTLDPTQNYADAIFPVVTLDGNQFVEEAPPTGPTVIDQGETETVTGDAASAMAAINGASGGITVTDANSLLVTTIGPFIIGDGGLGSLAIEADGKVANSDATIANTASAGGSSVNVTGANSLWQITGTLDVGNAATGLLAIAAGATVTATSLDAGIQSGGDGIIAVTGSTTALTLSTQLTIGDHSSADLAISNGATVSATDADIGLNGTGGTSPGGSGVIDLEGAGSTLNIADNLNIGDAGTGALIMGAGTTLQVVNNLNIGASGALEQFGGVIDPNTLTNSSPSAGGGDGASLDVGRTLTNNGVYTAGPGTYTINVGTAEVVGGATFYVGGTLDGSGELVVGTTGFDGDLVLNAGTVTAGQTVEFNAQSTSEVLTLGTLAGFAAKIGSFNTTAEIIVAGQSIVAVSMVGNTATLFGGGNTELGTLNFAPGAVSGGFLTTNGAGDVIEAPCFAARTRIATETGEVAVEAIGVGDRVRVLLGEGLSEVIWIGRREVHCARHPRPKQVWPVRIAAGAFGPGRPHSDLWLSPDHAVYVKDVLIPIKHLINGSTIAQVKVDQVTYHHIELTQHDVLLAEGLPAESFLDMRDGSNYANRPGPVRLYPDFSARVWEAFGCARLVVTGAELAAARAMVAAAEAGQKTGSFQVHQQAA